VSDTTTPAGMTQDGADGLRIEWRDGRVDRHAVRDLRLACPCAACVDEWTGRAILKDEDVPLDVRPVRIRPVGRYAIQITWTDGHDSGIYTFERLRELADR